MAPLHYRLRQILFFLGFWVCNFNLLAQSSLDQLEAHWSAYTPKDSVHNQNLRNLALQELKGASLDSAKLAQGYHMLSKTLSTGAHYQLLNEALLFGDTLLSIVPEKAFPLLYVNINIALANHHIQLVSHHKALPYIQNLKPFSLSFPKKVAPKYYELISGFYLENDQYFKAIQANNEAMVLYDSLGILKELCKTKTTLGRVYLGASNYPEALRLFRSSLKCIEESKSDSIALIDAFVNLGIVFFRQDQFDSALYYYQEASDIHHRNHGNIINMAVIQANLGNVKSELKLYDEALLHYDSSLAISEEINSTYGIALNTINIAGLYNNKKMHHKALKALEQIHDDVNSSNNNNMKMQYIHRLAETKYGLEQYKAAYEDLSVYLVKRDSAEVSAEKVKSLTWETQFKQQNAELELKQLTQAQLQSELEKRNILLYSGLIIMLLLAGGSGYFFYINKKTLKAKLTLKENELLKIENERKARELTTTALKLTQSSERKQFVANELNEVAKSLDGEYKAQVIQIANKMARQDDLSRWKEFELLFNDVHNNFYQKLKSEFPELTPHELKICGLLRLNLTSKDIADITARTPRTINNTRSSIRTKLGLDSNNNLIDFLMQF